MIDGCTSTSFTSTPPFTNSLIFDIRSGTSVLGTGSFTQSNTRCPAISYSLRDNLDNAPNQIFSISTNQIIVTTNSPSDIGTYNLKLFGSVIGPYSTYISSSITFQVIVIDC